jgi:hypothetical protein
MGITFGDYLIDSGYYDITPEQERERDAREGGYQMTAEQAKWLNEHRAEGYRALGVAPGGSQWVKVGMLHADGTFELKLGRARPAIRVGSFEVGVLESTQAPQMRGP